FDVIKVAVPADFEIHYASGAASKRRDRRRVRGIDRLDPAVAPVGEEILARQLRRKALEGRRVERLRRQRASLIAAVVVKRVPETGTGTFEVRPSIVPPATVSLISS